MKNNRKKQPDKKAWRFQPILVKKCDWYGLITLRKQFPQIQGVKIILTDKTKTTKNVTIYKALTIYSLLFIIFFKGIFALPLRIDKCLAQQIRANSWFSLREILFFSQKKRTVW